MLSNPPYGKSWKSDLDRMGGKDGLKDPRFLEHAGRQRILVTRTSDGQMLFLVNMLSKMKKGSKLILVSRGARICQAALSVETACKTKTAWLRRGRYSERAVARVAALRMRARVPEHQKRGKSTL